MHPDHERYFHFTNMSRLDKAINTLLGIVEGIAADARITKAETEFLRKWLDAHKTDLNYHPFNELVPVIEEALADCYLAEEEREDIVWMCEKMRSTEYHDAITADLQRLHAIMGGIAADRVITREELTALADWLSDHEHLRRCWPYEEVGSIITSVMSDGRIDEREHEFLLAFFDEFVAAGENRTISQPPIALGSALQGLCAVCPEITFRDSLFCFTGASLKCTRNQFREIVVGLGAKFSNSVIDSLDYLIVGADGNPCWAYACYGRKVEKAVELRKKGRRVLLVREDDFHDAVADMGGS